MNRRSFLDVIRWFSIILGVLGYMCPALGQIDGKINRLDAKGRKQGLWISKDRKLNYKGYFKDDMPTGWFEYTRGDTLVAKARYFRGGYASYNQFFRADGSMMCEGYYLDKKKDSLWTFYSPAGKVLKQESFEFGLLDGCCLYYDENGDLVERQHWFRGLRNGDWYVHDLNGYQFYQYKLNLTHGSYKALYPDSTLFIEGQYVDGVKEGKWSFYLPGGSLYKEDSFYHNKLQSRVLYVKIEGKLRAVSMDTVRMVMLNPQGGKAEILMASGRREVCDDSFENVCSIFDLDFFFYANKNTFVAFSGVDGESFRRILDEKGLSEPDEVMDGQLDPGQQLGSSAAVSPIRLPLLYTPPFPVFLDANGLNVLRNNMKDAEVADQDD